jgi:ElaB/YqjD/DUF883 family membrane-anchored ribosome-binding protein
MNAEIMESSFETPGALRHDAHTLAEDARALLTATSEIADQKIAEARDRLAATLESGKQTYARFQEKTAQGARMADEAVRNNPYKTVAMAFVLGTIVGLWLTRRG